LHHCRAVLQRAVSLLAQPEILAPAISATIIDHALSDGDISTLCERLSERNVPYVIHSGYPRSEELPADVLHVPKPADPRLLVTMVGLLLEGREEEPIALAGSNSDRHV
jgi:hypothetical protein